MRTGVRHFLLERGQVRTDDLFGACLVGWIGGVGATLIGSTAMAIAIGFRSDFDGLEPLIGFPLFIAIFALPIGICASLPLVWLLQALSLLNGFSVSVVGALVVSPLVLALGLLPFGALALFVGICTGAAAWHAGAHYSDDAEVNR